MGDYREEVGRRLREAREAAGLSQGDLALALAVTREAYGHYERGRSLMALDQLVVVCRVLGRPATYFMGGGGVVEVAGLTAETQEVVGVMESLSERDRETALVFVRFVAQRADKRGE